MPQMANIVVKKADGTTDITWTAVTASAGDSIPARWTSDSAAAIRGHRPTFEQRSQYNGPRTARRVTETIKFPIIRGISGVDTKVGEQIVELSYLQPVDVTDSEAAECVAQATNLFASVLNRACLNSAYSAT